MTFTRWYSIRKPSKIGEKKTGVKITGGSGTTSCAWATNSPLLHNIAAKNSKVATQNQYRFFIATLLNP
jgi:hypothetical protein